MDKKNSILNVGVAVFFKIILLAASIIVRRFLIRCLGNDINGLNSLFVSILGVLSVAELGIGSAISFCMYKPIVEGDGLKVSALYGLFTRLYLIIGAIIFGGGLAVMPLLPYLAKGFYSTGTELYLTFFLMLISVVITYLFSAKTSLINAYKNNYITTLISSCGMVLQYVAQIAVLLATQSYILFLICSIVAAMLQWWATEIVTRRKYKTVIANKQKLDEETKSEVSKKIKAMFGHKIGWTLVNAADSLIISTFIGVVILGKYSNYLAIMTAMTSVLTLCFTPLTSIIGQACAAEGQTQVRKYFSFFYTFNFLSGVIFYLGYYAVIDDLVAILFSEGLDLPKSTSLVLTINYFIQFMRNAVLLFRDATGTFYNDRWKPLFEGVTNIVLSIAFVYIFEYLFGSDFAVVGVIVATIITNLFICHIIEPHVLFKYAFNASAKKYYIRNYIYIAVFVVVLFLLNVCMVHLENRWLDLLANGAIAVGISIVSVVGAVIADKDFRHYAAAVVKRRR